MIVVKTADCVEHRFYTATKFKYKRFGRLLVLYNPINMIVAVFNTKNIFGFWAE